MSPVIQVEHLSKHYRLGLIGGGTLRQQLLVAGCLAVYIPQP